jgi:arginase
MEPRSFDIIGAAFGIASRHPGTARAPHVLREAGLLNRLQTRGPHGIDVRDCGDVAQPEQVGSPGDPKMRYLNEVLECAEELMAALSSTYDAGRTPIVLGGDHSISIATISVAAQALRTQRGAEARLGVLWVDAHGDIHTRDTTSSGNIHGMSLAHLLGHGDRSLCELGGFSPKIRPSDLVYIGLRDLEEAEKEVIRSLGILAFSMKEVDQLGIGEVCRRAFHHLAQKTDRFVLSFDLDVCDPNIAPGVGTPVRGGLTFRESHLIMELAAEAPQLMAIELVEYNPDIDSHGTTAELAMALLESAVGKTIL